MPLDIISFRDKYKKFYGDMSLDDVAKDMYNRGGFNKQTDYDSWKQSAGIDSALEEDRRLRNPTFEDKLRAAVDQPSEPSGLLRRAVVDPAVSLVKGTVVGIPEAVVGLADIPTMGYAGKAVDTVLKSTVGGGFKEGNEFFDQWLSPETREAKQKVEEAKGFVETVGTALQNPSSIVSSVAESLPSMFGGAGLGRLALKGLGKGVLGKEALEAALKGLSKEEGEALIKKNMQRAIAGGAVGEGLITAGQNTEGVRQQTEDGLLSPVQVAATTGSGFVTGLISRMSGGLASRLKIPDVDALMQGAYTGETKLTAMTVLKGLIGSAITEGALEELPQSAQEQMAQNIALGKPTFEGVAEAGAMGLLAGAAMGVMGGGAGMIKNGGKDEKQPPDNKPPDNAARKAKMLEVIDTGLQTGKYKDKDFTPDTAIQFIDYARKNGIISDEELDNFKDKYPQLRDGINGLIAENLTKKIDEAVSPKRFNYPKKPPLTIEKKDIVFRDQQDVQDFEDETIPPDTLATAEKLQDQITRQEEYLNKNANRKGGKQYEAWAADLEQKKAKLAEIETVAETNKLKEEIAQGEDHLSKNAGFKGAPIYDTWSKSLQKKKDRLAELTGNVGNVTFPAKQENVVTPAETLAAGKVNVPPAEIVETGAKAPELMTPEEFDTAKAQRDKELGHGEVGDAQGFIGNNQRIIASPNERSPLRDALEARKPVNAALFDRYNKDANHPLSLPEGYTKEGDHYIFKGEAETALPAPLSQTDAATVGVTTDEAKSGESAITAYHGSKEKIENFIPDKMTKLPIYENGKKVADVPVTFLSAKEAHAQTFGKEVTNAEHKKAVQQAISEGKITEHPDYPELKQPPPTAKSPQRGFETLPQHSQDKFNTAFEGKDVKTIQSYLANDNIKAEFEKRTGLKLPKYGPKMKKAVADYYKKLPKEKKAKNNIVPVNKAQNAAQFLIKAGKVRLGPDFSAKTGTAWDRAHGKKGKDQSRELGIVAEVTSKNGKLSMDEAADMLNAEGFPTRDGGPWTDEKLFQEMAYGDLRNVLHPEHAERIIEKRIEDEAYAKAIEQEEEYFDRQREALAQEGIDAAGEIEENSEGVRADLISEIENEGHLTEEQFEAAYDEISSFFDEMSKAEPRTETTDAGEQHTLAGLSANETFSLTANEPATPVVKGAKLTPKNLQPKEKVEDMFGEGAESKPEIKEWQDIPELDAQIRTIKEPVKDSKYWTVEIGVQESLGEQGGDILTWEYDAKPTLDEIKKDILDHYKKEKIEINTEVGIGIVAKTGRDEMREEAIDKVLENKPAAKSQDEINKEIVASDIDGFTKDLNPMQKGKVLSSFATQRRTPDYGITTSQAMIEKMVADGRKPAIKESIDERTLGDAKIERARIFSDGNQNIQAKRVKELDEIIANPPNKISYRMVEPDGSFTNINKTEYDYAKYLTEAQQPAAKQPSNVTVNDKTKVTRIVELKAQIADYEKRKRLFSPDAGLGIDNTALYDRMIKEDKDELAKLEGQAAPGATADSGEESLLSIAKDINNKLGEKGSIDFEPIVKFGQKIWDAGHQTYEKFITKAKELFGNTWDKVKYLVKQAWDKISEERGSFSTKEANKYNRRAIKEYGLATADESIGYITRDGREIDSSGISQGSRSQGRIDNQANQEYTNTKGEQDERQADDMREGRGRNDLESEVSKERERRVGIARQRILGNQNSPPRLRAAIAEGKEKGLIHYPEGAKSKEYQEVLAFAKSNGIIDVIPVIDTSGQIDGFIRDGIMFINMNTDDVPLLQTAKHEISHFLGNQETQDKINKDSQAFRKYWMVLSRSFGRSLSEEFVAEEYAAELESGAITRHGINLKEGLKTGETVTAISKDGQGVRTLKDLYDYERYMTAWHGSPHTFDKFSKDKIGTGEGAQAYGYGLYFAGKREVAEFYKESVGDWEFDGESAREWLRRQPSSAMQLARQQNIPIGEAAERMVELKPTMQAVDAALTYGSNAEYMLKGKSEALSTYRQLRTEGRLKNPGRLYKVELAPEEDEYLLWDKPLSEQSEKVKKAINTGFTDAYEVASDPNGRWGFYDKENGYLDTDLPTFNSESSAENFLQNPLGETLYRFMESTKGSDKAASDYLHSLGIRGIKYLDGTSRGKGEGNYNYVLFSENDIEITERYSVKKQFTEPDKSAKNNHWWEGRDVQGEIEGVPRKWWEKTVRNLINEGYVPITRAEADDLYNRKLDEFAAWAMIRGQETTGVEGLYMEPPLHHSPQGIKPYRYGEVKELYDKYRARYLQGREREIAQQEGRETSAVSEEAPLQEVAEDGGRYSMAKDKGPANIPAKTTPQAEAGILNGVSKDNLLSVEHPFFEYTDDYSRRKGEIHTVGYRYGEPPDSGRSYNSRDSKYEQGVSMASAAGGDQNNLFAVNYLIDRGVKKVYLEGDIIGFGGDDEPIMINAKKITKQQYEKSLKASKGKEASLLLAIDKAKTAGRLMNRGYDGYDKRYAKSLQKLNELYDSLLPNPSSTPDGGVRYSIRHPADPLADHWNTLEHTKFDDFMYNVADKHIDVKDVISAIKMFTRGIVDETKDVYRKVTNYSGRLDARYKEFMQKEFQPVMEALGKAGITRGQFEEYLLMRHAKEANAYYRRNKGTPDGGSGVLDAKVDAYFRGEEVTVGEYTFDTLSTEANTKMQPIADMIDAITHKSAQTLLDYGVESNSTIGKWLGSYQHYVPLSRDDDPVYDRPKPVGFSVSGSSSARRQGGSDKMPLNILANIAEQREKYIKRGEKNIIAKALYSLAKNNPNPEFWEVAKPDVVPRVNVATGELVPTLDDRYKDDRMVIMSRQIGPDGEIIERGIRFNAKNDRAARMALALKNLDLDSIGAVLGTMAKVTRYMASINTQYNPIFGITNFFRDLGTMALNLSTTPIAGKQAQVAKGIPAAMMGISQALRGNLDSPQAKLFKEFQMMGGQTGYVDLYKTAEDRTKEIDKQIKMINGKAPVRGLISWAADALSNYNTSIENAVRLSAYEVGLANGMSKDAAAAMAKDLTVNFNRKGQWASQAGAMYAFFNASVQGSMRMYETLKGPKAKKIIAGGLIFGAVQAMALAAAGFGDDEPPDFVRERNIIIPIGGKKYITIPMPLGFNVIPSLGRIPVEIALAGGKNADKKMFSLFGLVLEAFNPMGSSGLSLQTFMPTIADPFVALAENKDWTGKPIYKENFNSLNPAPGHARAKDTSSLFGQGLSYALNMATGGSKYTPGYFSPTPDQIDYLVGQATGGVGREIGKASQTVRAINSGEDLPTYKIPVVSRFYGNAEGASHEGRKFYDNVKEMNMFEREIKGLRSEGKSVSEYLKDNPEARYFAMANKTEAIIRKLKTRRDQLKDRDANPEVIKRIDDQITTRMRRLNEIIDRAKKT